MKLTIITVCFNCLDELKKTISSIVDQEVKPFEHLIIDGNSKDGTKEYLNTLEFPWLRFTSEPDKGVYDAMNKGVKLAQGDALLFLNAGDNFEGQVLKYIESAPCFLPVKLSRLSFKPKQVSTKSYKLGMPNCHQGIIFEAKNILYDLNYKIASDYDFYLRHGYKMLPMVQTDIGCVFYDNNGLSQKQSLLRDEEIYKIIRKNFGPFHSKKFWVYAQIKKKLKSVIRVFK